MQIVIDKETLVKMLKVSLYVVTGADYEDVGKVVEELLDKIGYVELPENHGRLGDLDELEREITNGINAGNYEEGYEEYPHINDMDDCVDAVKYTPTIIEGTEGKE